MNVDPDSGGSGSSSGGQELNDQTAQTATRSRSAPRSSAVRAMIHRAGAPSSRSEDAAASALASTSPTGVATTNPALLPASRTPGVARAWSPRKAAADTKAIDTRNSRASRRRSAAVPIVHPSTAETAAVPSTSQKWLGRCSQCTSVDGAASRTANPISGSERVTPRTADVAGDRTAPDSATATTYGATGAVRRGSVTELLP